MRDANESLTTVTYRPAASSGTTSASSPGWRTVEIVRLHLGGRRAAFTPSRRAEPSVRARDGYITAYEYDAMAGARPTVGLRPRTAIPLRPGPCRKTPDSLDRRLASTTRDPRSEYEYNDPYWPQRATPTHGQRPPCGQFATTPRRTIRYPRTVTVPVSGWTGTPAVF